MLLVEDLAVFSGVTTSSFTVQRSNEQLIVAGSGFTWSDGPPADGTIATFTGMSRPTVLADFTEAFTITGLTLDLGDFAAALNANPARAEVFAAMIFHAKDTLVGSDGIDRLYAFGGNDEIRAGLGNDFAYGGEGNDTVMGEDDDDQAFGGNGNDLVDGGIGDDYLGGDQSQNSSRVTAAKAGTTRSAAARGSIRSMGAWARTGSSAASMPTR